MTDLFDVVRINSPAETTETPLFSILIPYYHDNPAELVDNLCRQTNSSKVEILIYDDGTGNAKMTATLAAMVTSQSKTSVSMLTAHQNKGRSFARNYLMDASKADWVLYLDADMRPDTPSFISNYLNAIHSDGPDIIFGGFKVPDKSEDIDRELHRSLSLVSDCLSLEDRQAAGPQFVCSSNLCVRKSVMIAEPFDSEFSGWGWEDSEWAARVSKRFNLVHIDNPAIHLGLETTDTLLKRFQTSGPNYRRFTDKHPALAHTLSLYKISKKLGYIPGQTLMRPWLKMCVKLNKAPIRLRLLALKLWRASWYAETLS